MSTIVISLRQKEPRRGEARSILYHDHKLIVASVRRGTYRAKSEKDLAQAEWLIAALAESRPFELAEALDAARDRGSKWRRALESALDRRPALHDMLIGL